MRWRFFFRHPFRSVSPLGGGMTLGRFLVIYCSFAVLFFFLMAPVYSYIKNAVHQSEIQRCTTRLETGAAALNQTLDTVNNVATVTAADYRFRSLLFTDYEMDYTSAALELKKMQRTFAGMLLSTPLAMDAGLIIRDGLVFSRQRLCYAAKNSFLFYPQYIQCEDLTWPEWRAMLDRSKNVLLPAARYATLDNGTYSAVTYAARWPLDYRSSGCYLYCIIPTNTLFQLMADQDVLLEGYVAVSDKEGKLLATSGEKGQGTYTELSCEVRLGGVFITVGVPEAVLSTRLQPITRLIVGYIVGVVLIALAAILIFSYQSARPMRTLLAAFQSVRGPDEIAYPPTLPPNGKKQARLQKDYQFLAHNIRTMGDELKTSKHTIEAQQQILYASIWERALTRGLYSSLEISQFQALYPSFPSLWRLAVIRYAINGDTALEEYAAHQVRLCAMLAESVPGAIAQNVENGIAAMLLPAGTAFDPDALEEKFAAQSQGIEISACALSEEYVKIEELHKAYQQALDLTFLPGGLPRVRQAQDVSNESFSLPLSITDVEILYNALRSANAQVAEQIRLECLEELRKDPDNAVIWRFSYQQIASAAARLRLEFPGRLAHVIIPTYDHIQREKLFSQDLPACFQAICQALDLGRASEENRQEKIIQYIDAHLSDSQLDISVLADVFRVSATTLQKIVRARTGMSVANYIENCRIERVKRLLSETELPVREIAAQCGFNSVNSFYKVFKRHSGITPNTMRQLYSEHKEE